MHTFCKTYVLVASVFLGFGTSVYSQNLTKLMGLNKVEKPNHKHVIYQLFVRQFGNETTKNTPYGTIDENGCGKFNDVNDAALQQIKKFGATHVWAFGVVDHLTMTDYSAFGIPNDNPWLIKGKAGSPFAIKDYYDVSPDLAVSVPNRMAEFEAMVKRIHKNGLKVIIDFVPNHVARSYRSNARPENVQDFGETDDFSVAFSPQNNFYYVPGQQIKSFDGVNLPEGVSGPLWTENPAKATGNDVFHAHPSVNDWYETVKLNYGVDYVNGRSTHFQPTPSTWLKMRDILLFWVGKGIDGVRCDMAEMVPVEFWEWVIPQVKEKNKNFIFVAEIYNPREYHNYILKGKFDYLYDKVGMYDALRRLMEGHGNANDITQIWQQESGDIAQHMLRFLENHDEQRVASEFFAKNAEIAIPSMTLSATLHNGPILIYNGQELGEKGMYREGFHGANGPDGRTTIFDYWGLKSLQDWRNKGKFDGKKLSFDQKRLYSFYQKLNHFVVQNHAVYDGAFYDLQYANSNGQSAEYDDTKIYTFLRHSYKQRLLIICNFDLNRSFRTEIKIPSHAWETMYLDPNASHTLNEIFLNQPTTLKIKQGTQPVKLTLPANSVMIFEIK